MDPISTSQALRLIASNIDASNSPSISDTISDLSAVLQYVESDGSRTAGEHVAGPIDWMKGLKRKLVNTKGEKKILDRMDHLNELMKWSKGVTKKIRNGEDLYDIASDEDYLQVLEGAAKFMSGGSDLLNELSEDDADVGSILTELDEYWADEDNEEIEETDRDIIINAISEFSSESENRINKDKKRLLRQESRQRDGKKIPVPESKRRKPEKKPREESREESREEPAKKPLEKKKRKL